LRQYLGLVALLVRDYDEALAFFIGKLDFELIEDSDLGGGKRWVVVAPPAAPRVADGGTRLLLARAAGPAQARQMGRQGADRVFLFLHTDDFWRDYRRLRARGVTFHEAPREESYGTVAVFEDLYGNRWDLLQPAADRG
jgi:catechol 2,3-dioxygenase-like lactoylglutathione lyase family enzyme